MRVRAAALEGDRFCQDVFHRAGRHLGRMGRTCLFPRDFHPRSASAAAGDRAAALPSPRSGDVVSCVCVGSLWRSFQLLARGFHQGMYPTSGPGCDVDFALTLVTLQLSSAVGAAWLAAKVPSLCLPPLLWAPLVRGGWPRAAPSASWVLICFVLVANCTACMRVHAQSEAGVVLPLDFASHTDVIATLHRDEGAAVGGGPAGTAAAATGGDLDAPHASGAQPGHHKRRVSFSPSLGDASTDGDASTAGPGSLPVTPSASCNAFPLLAAASWFSGGLLLGALVAAKFVAK